MTDTALVTVDAAGALVGWNAHATELLGYAAPDVLGRDVADVLVPLAYQGAHRRGFAAAMGGGRLCLAGRGAHLPVLHADGTTLVLAARFDVLRAPDGDPAGAVASCRRPTGEPAPFSPVGAPWPVVRRVVANLPVAEPALDAPFWVGMLGMATPMDQGWVVNHSAGTAQVQMISRDATSAEDSAVSVEVESVAALEAVHEQVVGAGWEIVHALGDEPWGVRRFFLRTPGGVVVNVLAHP